MARLFEKLRLIDQNRDALTADDAEILTPLSAHMEAGVLVRATDEQLERVDALYSRFTLKDAHEPV
jgi:hypothetical protein